MTKKKIISLLIVAIMTFVISCDKEDSLDVPMKTVPLSKDEIDVYLRENFSEKYGVAVRYKFVDRYVNATKRVTPPKREKVIPMLEFLTDFWIEPFISVPNGEEFFKKHVPPEVILIGSTMYNSDGTVTLGVADAGARITLTEVNDIDVTNKQWILRQLGTIYHEFAHIMHQRYSLPVGWANISPQGYTSSGEWYVLSEDEALKRGFVSPYATSSVNEDYAELVAHLLFVEDFYNIYHNDDTTPNCTDCAEKNVGRAKIRQKYNAVLTHYKQFVGVDLLEVREIIQQKLPQ